MPAKPPSVGQIVDRALAAMNNRERTVFQVEAIERGYEGRYGTLVKRDLDTIRESGQCNMLERPCVIVAADDRGLAALRVLVHHLSGFEFLQLITAYGEARSQQQAVDQFVHRRGAPSPVDCV